MGFTPLQLALDCSRVSSRVELQQGYVSAHLLLSNPGETPGTGAVARSPGRRQLLKPSNNYSFGPNASRV